MRTFKGSTEEEAVKLACSELGIDDPSSLPYQVISTSKTLFGTECTIGIFTIKDVIQTANDYIMRCLKALGLEGTTQVKYDDESEVIKINIVCDKNKVVIGRNGDTLRSINELTRSACFNKYGGHYRILLNCDGYKEHKYDKLVQMANYYAQEVMRSKIMVTLDPMTSDERRVVHQALSEYPNISTKSFGTGHKRHITIQYIDNPAKKN